jgi:hypothetical protein
MSIFQNAATGSNVTPLRGNEFRKVYREPPKDQTPVKCEIVRGCWVTVTAGAPAVAVKPGQILQLPRWLADVLIANGKAST